MANTRIGALIIALLLATPARAASPDGMTEKTVVELLFGRNIGARTGVSEQAFRRFIDADVTPRFPDGFTVIDMSGQYRDTKRDRIIREPGKLILIALADETAGMTKVRELIDTYKRRFEQQSVGLITRRSCVSF